MPQGAPVGEERVEVAGLVGSAGLGSGVSVAPRQLTLPGPGDAAALWGRTVIGSAQRCLLRVPLLFGDPVRVPRGWLVGQYALARLPGFLDTSLAAPTCSGNGPSEPARPSPRRGSSSRAARGTGGTQPASDPGERLEQRRQVLPRCYRSVCTG